MATVAAAAVHHHGPGLGSLGPALTNGYDHAFAIVAAALVVGAGLALLLPGLARTEVLTAASDDAGTPVALTAVEA